MSLKHKVLAGAAVGLVGVVALAAGAWYFVLRDNSPPPVSLESALESLATTTPEAAIAASTETTSDELDNNDGATTEPTVAAAETSEDASLAGTWTLVQGDNSFVGYRVAETLASIGATTAVGRTSDIDGTLEFDGSAITGVEVTADLTTLESDSSMRDGQLRNQAIETGTYLTATFVLASSIEIGELPPEGESVVQTVAGQLTLHGVTRDITIEIEGVIQGGQLVVVGSTEIQFADYDIDQPVSMSVVSIEDHGTMEFQLVFAQVV